jgi:hypothetical protein
VKVWLALLISCAQPPCGQDKRCTPEVVGGVLVIGCKCMQDLPDAKPVDSTVIPSYVISSTCGESD